MEGLEILKRNIREKDFPFFGDSELSEMLMANNGDIRKTSYECLIIKAENTGLNVSGLSTSDSSAYFKMLASKFVKTNTGILL